MANQLNIQVGADVSGAVRGLQQLETQTNRSFRAVAQSSGTAQTSLINLSRVAQDAPFGFIGIANNINPLVESFGRLKTETGSTRGAFKALAGSLAGAGGLSLAVGVASSLLVVFGDKLFGIGKGAKAASDETEKLGQSVANDLVKLTSLVGLASNLNASYENRQNALKALNDQYGKYLQGLDTEKITAQNLSAAYDQITESLLRQAVVKGSQAEIEKIVTETAGKIIALRQKEIKTANDATEAYRKQNLESTPKPSNQALLDRYVKRKESETGIIKDGTLAIESQQIAQNQSIRSVNIYDSLIKKLTVDLKNQLEPLMSLTTEFSDLDTKLKNVKDTSEKFVLFPDLDLSLFKAKEFNKLLPKEKLIDIGKIRLLVSNVDLETKLSFFQQLQKETTDKLEKAFPGAFKFKVDDKSVEELKKVLELSNFIVKLNDFIASQISGIVSSAFSGLFDALKQGENAFRAFGNSAINALLGVIEKLLATAATAAILSFLFPTTGVGGAVGFQNIFSSLLGFKTNARANGGPVSGNSPYIVGERGPELFVPSVSGNVVPNNQLGSFNGRSGFGTSGMGGRSIVRGNDILLAYARTQRSISRVNA